MPENRREDNKMVFSSLTFLQLFLPVTMILYYTVPQKYRNGLLFALSLVFYAWGEPVYVFLMIFSTVLDYCCGLYADRYRGSAKAKIPLIISVTVNLSLLCLFKYSDLLVSTANSILGTDMPLPGLPLPIGISFYTFQTMSYTIDVYRGDTRVQKNIISFGAYVALFPQLIAGPIVRYRTVAEQIDCRIHTADKFSEGVKRFITGLGKKVILANNIGLLWETVQSMDSAQMSVFTAWLGLAAYGMQIYFDFSGYSDMAIGLGKMLGFDFPENFNYPFISKSITEFWRRWHISLGTWFRDYVYIPLGGNKCSKTRQLFNIALVWLLTGFWHGASWNFLIWGAFFGLLLIAEKYFLLEYLEKAPAATGHLYTLFFVTVNWVFFVFEDISKGLEFLGMMFGKNVPLINSAGIYLLSSYGLLFAVCIIAAMPLGKKAYAGLEKKCGSRKFAALNAAGAAVIITLAAAYLISGSYNPFLYFRF